VGLLRYLFQYNITVIS